MAEASWRINMLGRLQARWEQQTLNHLSMRRVGALLACLALRAPHPVPREELLELLWPDVSSPVARNRLSVLLSALRQHLEPAGVSPESVLLAERHTVQLLPTAFTSDYHDLLTALHAAKSAPDDAAAIAHLENAIALYQGELLAGFYDEWILTERARLAALHYQALRELSVRLVRTDAPERAIDYARLAVTAEPLDEEAHCDLIRLYRKIGQPSTALRQYEQLTKLLREELRAAPSAAARELAAQIEGEMGHGATQTKRIVRPMMPRAAALPERAPNVPDSLPPRLTRFFGREEEMLALKSLLAPDGSTRLLTLLGPGGTGKTRLAVETAEQLKTVYSGRVYFAALADISDTNHIGSVIARTLRLRPTPGLDPLSQALAVLNQASSLLVLDNLEQLLPDAGPLIEHLLGEATTLRCLITSRRSIGVEGEQEYVLGPLRTPDARADMDELSTCPVVALFVDRVRLIHSDFTLSAKNAEDVVQLCRDLEGLPLAIELAAGRAGVMTPGEMRQQPGKLLNWLVDVRGGKNSRHRSLRSTLEWSYRLLSLAERRFFSALSVFVGGFTAEAAGCVAHGEGAEPGEAITMLERLRAVSLLNVVETDDATTRFRKPETLREFGLERLAEMGTEAEVRRRHLTYFADGAWKSRLRSSVDNARDLARIAAEDGNLRAALEYGLRPEALADEQGMALRLAIRLSDYWERQGHWAEGRDFLRRVNALPNGVLESADKITVLRRAGILANLLGDYAEARSFSEEGLALAQAVSDEPGTAGCLSNLGSIAFSLDDYMEAERRFDQALQLFQQAGEMTNVAACLTSLGNVAFFLGNHAVAQARLEQALTLYRQRGDRQGAALVLLRLGNVLRNQSCFALGRTHLLESLAIYEETGNRQGVASCMQGLGVVAFFQSDYPEAQIYYNEALHIFQEIGFRRGVGTSLGNLGSLALDLGDYTSARFYFQSAMEIYHLLRDRRNMAACLGDLGNVALNLYEFAEAERRFHAALELEADIGSRGGTANCLLGLGRLALEQKHSGEARRRLSRALDIYEDMNVPAGVAETLEALSILVFADGRTIIATRLLGVASVLRAQIGYFRSSIPRMRDANLAALRADLQADAFTAAWQQGEAMPRNEAIAEALEQVSQ
jgi:predicted ATPase/DNA-binding SARP family transcriptional activator